MSVRKLNVREQKELLTCGFLQMLRLHKEQVFEKKLCPSGHFSGRKLAGSGRDWSKNGEYDQKRPRNGPKWVEMGNIDSKLIGTLKGHVFHLGFFKKVPFRGLQGVISTKN